MADFGIEVSRIGYDVDTASDKQLAFSSNWPLLPIEAEGTATLTPAGGGGFVTETLYEHDLGYPPVFMTMRVSGASLYYPAYVYCDSDDLIYDGYLTEETVIKWKVFRRSLLTNYEAENINLSDATKQEDEDYGLFVSLPGKDISSTDKRDFCIRSDVRQLMIHKTGYTTTPSQSGDIEHNLGYKPMYFLYREDTTTAGKWICTVEADDFRVSADTTNLDWQFYGSPGFNYAYLIFKDTLDTDG